MSSTLVRCRGVASRLRPSEIGSRDRGTRAGAVRLANGCLHHSLLTVTLIVAWQRGEDAFIVGDSAVTTLGTHAGQPLTSFGQPQQHDNFAVEEGAIKIWEIAPNMIVGVAGHVARARAFLDEVRQELAAGGELNDILSRLCSSLEEEGERRFQLVFAHRVHGHTELFRIDSQDAEDTDEPVWILGSGDDRVRALVTERIKRIGGNDDPRATADLKLAAAVASLNALNVTEHLTPSFIGGTFFGARLSASGLSWQDDLALLLYDPRFVTGRKHFTVHDDDSGVERIFTCIRGNAGLVFSSIISDRGRLLPPPWPQRTVAEWQQVAHDAYPSGRVTFEHTQMFAFIAKAYPHVTVVKRKPGSDDPLWLVGERVEINESLVESLGSTQGNGFQIRYVVGSAE
jgi:ATP-dependent protease HslVU (ClpYQ) peptidase subunit